MVDAAHREVSAQRAMVSLRRAAELLGISTATVRNWTRSGLLEAADLRRPMKVWHDQVLRLQLELAESTTGRLQSRANKTQSGANRVPRERVQTRRLRVIERLVRKLKRAEIAPETLLVASALHQATVSGKDALASYLSSEFQAPGITVAIRELQQSVVALETTEDLVGLIYQELSNDGEKAVIGAFYTPRCIADATAERLIHGSMRIFDPCVGSGAYLVAAARRLRALGVECWQDCLVGADIDPLAVLATKLNLMLDHGDVPMKPLRIEVTNSLTDELDLDLQADGFDLVMTNPPWGARMSNNELRALSRRFPEIRSKESFSFFTCAGLRLLRKGGTLSYLLPSSVLTTSLHADLRNLMLESGLKSIITHGRAFSGMMTDVIELDLSPTAKGSDQIIIQRNEQSQRVYSLETDALRSSPTREIQIDLVGDAREIITQIEQADTFTLKGRATFGLGIVTGNNKEQLRRRPSDQDEAIYTGKEVQRYSLSQAMFYTTFDRDRFQQSARESLYRASPKLVYRFIARELVVALDTSGALTLNSANLIVPEASLDPYYLLGVLNARYASFYLKKKFDSLKVLKRHLEMLPIPRVSEPVEASIIHAVKSILRGEEASEHRRSIDSLLEDALGVSLREAPLDP